MGAFLLIYGTGSLANAAFLTYNRNNPCHDKASVNGKQYDGLIWTDNPSPSEWLPG